MLYDQRLSLSSCKSAFDPEALRVLQEAFDLAVVELASQGISIDDQLTRRLIARRIFEAARDRDEGETNRLKCYALQAFETAPRLQR